MSDITSSNARPSFDQLVNHLGRKFEGVHDSTHIREVAEDSYDRLRPHARIRTYLSNLAGHFTEERLIAEGQARGVIGKDRPEVLFVCDGRTPAAEMAAAIMRRQGDDLAHVRTAGVPATGEADAGTVNSSDPGRDVPATDQSHPLTAEYLRAADYVIALDSGLDRERLHRTGSSEPDVRDHDTQYFDWAVDKREMDTAEGQQSFIKAVEAHVADFVHTLRSTP